MRIAFTAPRSVFITVLFGMTVFALLLGSCSNRGAAVKQDAGEATRPALLTADDETKSYQILPPGMTRHHIWKNLFCGMSYEQVERALLKLNVELPKSRMAAKLSHDSIRFEMGKERTGWVSFHSPSYGYLTSIKLSSRNLKNPEIIKAKIEEVTTKFGGIESPPQVTLGWTIQGISIDYTNYPEKDRNDLFWFKALLLKKEYNKSGALMTAHKVGFPKLFRFGDSLKWFMAPDVAAALLGNRGIRIVSMVTYPRVRDSGPNTCPRDTCGISEHAEIVVEDTGRLWQLRFEAPRYTSSQMGLRDIRYLGRADPNADDELGEKRVRRFLDGRPPDSKEEKFRFNGNDKLNANLEIYTDYDKETVFHITEEYRCKRGLI